MAFKVLSRSEPCRAPLSLVTLACVHAACLQVIRGMATGQLKTLKVALTEQMMVGFLLGVVMALAAWFRVWVFSMGALNATAIALSCFAIVTMSVMVRASPPTLGCTLCVDLNVRGWLQAGTLLPFGLQRVGLDPAHAGASVQEREPSFYLCLCVRPWR